MLLLALGRHVVDDSLRAGDRKIFRFVESHPCDALCGLTRENPEGDDDARAAFNCALPGYSPAWWSEDDHDAEVYLHHHFTKVGEQTRLMMRGYLDSAAERSLPSDHIARLNQQVFGRE